MRRLTFKTPTGPLEYTITNRPRVTRRLHMEIDEHGGLVVVAPRHWSKAHISATLTQNIPRVERFLGRARQRQRQPLLYTSGELHLYLGERYPLVINSASGLKTSVVFSENKFRVSSRQRDPENIRLALQGWYLKQARKVFSARMQTVVARADWLDDRPIPLKLRRMKRTWGNCSSIGVIKLNTHLIKAPLPILDSVIAHELCHLKEMNHGRKFYAFLAQLNPSWKQDRARLRSEGNLYLL
jgi:predicted metal-dependent hydrolase